MKRCVKCKEALADSDLFCPKCGTRQTVRSAETGKKTAKDIYNDAVELVKDKLENSDAVVNAVESASSSSLNKVAFVGIALIAISTFMPLIKIIGFMQLTLMDYSKFLGFVIFAICGLMCQAVLNRKYGFLTVASNGLLLFFLVGFIYLVFSQAKMSRSIWGAVIGKAIDFDWGVDVFLLGVAIVEVVALLCSTMENSGTISISTLLLQWKKYTFESVSLLGIPLPGLVWSIILAAVLLFITSRANPMNAFERELNGYRKMFR